MFSFRKSSLTVLFAALVITIVTGLSLSVSCTRNRYTRENEVRLPIDRDPTLDWTLAPDAASCAVVGPLQEGLTQLGENLRVEGALAKSWGISPDGKTYEFTLKEVKWSDGVPLKASDFVTAWKRLLSPELKAPLAPLLFPIVNAEAFYQGKLKDFSKVGISTPDDRTLLLKLQKPTVKFLHVLSVCATFPLRQDVLAAGGKDFTEPMHIRTLGGFRVTEWQHNKRLFVEPNPYYYGAKPRIDKVYFQVVKDETAALTAYEKDQLEAVGHLVPLDFTQSSWPDHRTIPLFQGYYFSVAGRAKPFDKPAFREALLRALDDKELLTALKWRRANRTAFSLDHWLDAETVALNQSSFDPTLARTLLARAGYKDGKSLPRLKIVYRTAPGASVEETKSVADTLAKAWKTVLHLPITEVQAEAANNRRYLLEQAWGASVISLQLLAGEPPHDEPPLIPLAQTFSEVLIKPYVQNLAIDPLTAFRIKEAWIQRTPNKL